MSHYHKIYFLFSCIYLKVFGRGEEKERERKKKKRYPTFERIFGFFFFLTCFVIKNTQNISDQILYAI
jgi:hypothetical protein